VVKEVHRTFKGPNEGQLAWETADAPTLRCYHSQARMLEVSADMEAADDRNQETERALEEARAEADEYHGHIQQLMDAQRRIAEQLAEREAENEAPSCLMSGQLQDVGLVNMHCEETLLLSGMRGAEQQTKRARGTGCAAAPVTIAGMFPRSGNAAAPDVPALPSSLTSR
jgi:hypothetical protein